MHILNNTWITEFWYGFLVIIGLTISIVYYVNHKKKAFRQSLFLLLTLCLFSFTMHHIEEPDPDSLSIINTIKNIDNDNYGPSPDYLGKAIEQVYNFIKRKFL